MTVQLVLGLSEQKYEFTKTYDGVIAIIYRLKSGLEPEKFYKVQGEIEARMLKSKKDEFEIINGKKAIEDRLVDCEKVNEDLIRLFKESLEEELRRK